MTANTKGRDRDLSLPDDSHVQNLQVIFDRDGNWSSIRQYRGEPSEFALAVWFNSDQDSGVIVRYFPTKEEALTAGHILGHHFSIFRVPCDKTA
jgi:hypothetical protein